MNYVYNLMFQKQKFPDIFSSYSTKLNSPKIPDLSNKMDIAETYIYVYFSGRPSDIKISEVYNYIFSDNIQDDDSESILIKSGYNEKITRTGKLDECAILSPYVRDGYCWYFSKKFDRQVLYKALSVVVVGADELDFFKKKEVEKRFCPENIFRAKTLDELKKLLLEITPVYVINYPQPRNNGIAVSPAQEVAVIPIELELTNELVNISEDNRFDKMISKLILSKTLDYFQAQCCDRIVHPYLEEGNFSDNFIRVELFFKQYGIAKKKFEMYINGTLIDEILEINKNCKIRSEKHNAFVNSIAMKRYGDLFEHELMELKKLEENL